MKIPKAVQEMLREFNLNRPIKTVVKEKGDKKDTFSATYKIEQRAEAMGFVVGSLCRDKPVGIARADRYNAVAKWHNLDASDMLLLDGVVLSRDHRHGDSYLVLFADRV